MLHRLDVVFAEGRAPHVCVLVCAHAEEVGDQARTLEQLTIRGEDGEWTPEYLAFRAMFRWSKETS